MISEKTAKKYAKELSDFCMTVGCCGCSKCPFCDDDGCCVLTSENPDDWRWIIEDKEQEGQRNDKD